MLARAQFYQAASSVTITAPFYVPLGPGETSLFPPAPEISEMGSERDLNKLNLKHTL